MLYGDLYTKYDCIINNIKNKTFEVGNSIIKNDILFPQSTTVDAYSLISPACLNEEKAETSGVFVIRPYDNINGNFICYYTKGNIEQRKKLAKKAQGLTIVHLYYHSIKDETIMIPTKNEQDKISNILLNIDNLITLHHRKYTYIFYSWEQRKLGEIGNTFTGLSGKTKEDFGHGEAKFVTYMNVFSNPIAQLNKTEPIEIDNKQNQVEYGDVFFTTSSETPDEVGMSSVWLENKGNIYLNSFCFGFRPFVKNDPYYMSYMLRSKNFRKNMILLAQGISRYNISKNGVMNIDIQLPNNQEQEKIGKLFYEIDNLITLHLSIRNKEEKRFYKIMYKNPDKSLLERVMEFDYLQCLGVVEQNYLVLFTSLSHIV